VFAAGQARCSQEQALCRYRECGNRARQLRSGARSFENHRICLPWPSYSADFLYPGECPGPDTSRVTSHADTLGRRPTCRLEDDGRERGRLCIVASLTDKVRGSRDGEAGTHCGSRAATDHRDFRGAVPQVERAFGTNGYRKLNAANHRDRRVVVHHVRTLLRIAQQAAVGLTPTLRCTNLSTGP